MDLPYAIEDFASMLTLGAEALQRLAERGSDPASEVARVATLLDEIRASAARLTSLARELRKPSTN